MGWIVLSAFSFGILPIFARVAYASGMDPVTLLAFRFLIASLCMAPLLWQYRAELPRGARLASLVALGAIAFVGEALAFFYALQYAAVGMVALLLFLYPVMVAVGSALIFKERLGSTKIVALLAALLGTALTVGPSGTSRPLGIMLGILAAFIYSGFVLGSGYMSQFVRAQVSTAIIIMSAAASLCALMLMRGPQLPTNVEGWAATLAMGTVSTVGAILTFFLGLQRIGATRAATIATLEPLITTVAGAVFLSEHLELTQLLGGLFILAGVLVLVRSAGRAQGEALGPIQKGV